ncbi:MAG: choice-of-anchor B family protein [Planctomycetota bacterium]
MNAPNRSQRAALFVASCLVTGGLVRAHEDDLKVLHKKPAVPGSGYARGLAPGQPLPGGGLNARFTGGGVTTQALGGGTSFPAQDVTLRSWLTLGDLGGAASGNDIWGYVSPSQREYALIGTSSGVNVVEVTNPDVPSIIATIAGPNSLWRDIRTYQDRAYVVSEGGGGIQVLDLSDVDNGTVLLEGAVTTGGNLASHNVSIDTVSGYLYRCGGGSDGLRIYDLANPSSPAYVATWSSRYVHDAQIVTYTSGPLAGRQLAYCCAGLNGGWTDPTLTILDVTDKQNIQLVRQLPYPGRAYSHQGGLSEDRALYYLGDELDENGVISTTTHVFDVANPAAATYVGAFTNSTVAIGHNMFAAHGLLYQANYTSGLRIFDVTSNPTSPAEVAYFDTAPNSTAATFNSLWGVYPYLPSRTILCSDLESGLFVLSYTPPVGVEFCAGNPNSTGAPATIAGSGTPLLVDNSVQLTASNLPPFSSGYFIVSSQQGFTASPGGSQGDLCLGGALGRYYAQLGSSGAAGVLQLDVDAASLPQPNGTASAAVGESWSFQCWYRDANPGPTSNFSSGFVVRFQ